MPEKFSIKNLLISLIPKAMNKHKNRNKSENSQNISDGINDKPSFEVSNSEDTEAEKEILESLSEEINLSKEDQKKVMDAFFKSNFMLKELKKHLRLDDTNPVSVIIEENEKILDEIK